MTQIGDVRISTDKGEIRVVFMDDRTETITVQRAAMMYTFSSQNEIFELIADLEKATRVSSAMCSLRND